MSFNSSQLAVYIAGTLFIFSICSQAFSKMASSASFSIFILGILLTLKCEFLSAHAPAEEDSRLSVSSLLYQMIGDVYELQNENKMMKEKIEMLESGLESLESELETSHKGKMSLVVRKPVFGVSDQVRYKPGCTATEDG